MHEKRHFLSYQKCRHDTENHVHYVTLGSRCKMACWASYRFLPFTVFSLGLPFCFLRYIVNLRWMSEGGSFDV